MADCPPLKKPDWIRVRLSAGGATGQVRHLVHGHGLHTVCEEALCPNRGECWAKGRATLMILGDTCTRACRFCNVEGGVPSPCDADEPRRVLEAVRGMGLRDVVITSVTRDDLPDGGAALWAETIRLLHRELPGLLVEVLIPDFRGDRAALDTVLDAAPDVLAHNLETIERLYPVVRPQADYRRSLDLLRHARDRGFIVKTGIMVGLGETPDEVHGVLRDSREAGCDIFTIGQYLQPSRKHLPVREYVPPERFDHYREAGEAMGIGVVISAPLVRSSYHTQRQDDYVRRRLAGRTGPTLP